MLLWRTDEEGRVTRTDAWEPGDPEGDPRPAGSAGAAVHPDDRASVARAWQRAVAARTPVETEYRLRMADGTYRWMLDRGRPAFAGDGTFAGHVGATVDIHGRTEAEDEARLLEGAGALLAGAADPERALPAVAALCVPLLGDACAAVLEPGAAPERAVVVPGVPPALAAHLPPGAGAVVLAPLVARGTTLGVLAAAAVGPRRLGPRELRLARALADRIALAVDAARLARAALGARRESEETRGLLDAFFAAAPAGLAFFDADLRYLQVNDVLAEANGRAPAAHVGRRPSEVLGPFGRRVEELLQDVLGSGRPVLDLEFADLPDAHGRRRHWTCGFYPVRLANGAPAGVGVVATDVTARVAADRARGRLLDRAAFMAEAAEALDADLDYERTLQAIAAIPTGRVATWAVVAVRGASGAPGAVIAAHRDPGLAAEAQALATLRPVLGGPAGAAGDGGVVLHDELTPELLQVLGCDPAERAALERLGAASAVVAPLTARGRTLGSLTLVTASGSYDPEDAELARELGRRAGLALENARLYRRARTEQRASAAARTVLDAYIERAPIGFALLDGELRCRRVNARLCEIDGLAAEAHVGRTVAELVPGLAPEAVSALLGVLATGVPRTELPVAVEDPRRPGSPRRHFLVSAYRVALAGADGASGVGTTITEVTDRVEAEEALRSQRDLYETLLRAQSDMGEGFVLLAGDRILYVNAAAERIAGRTSGELHALPSFLHLFPPGVHEELGVRVRQLLERRRTDPGFETELLRPDGSLVPIELTAQPLHVDGRVQLVVVARDISERRREQLERERLLAAEQVARLEIAAAHARAQLLAELSEVMDDSMDLRVTLRKAARVLARESADAIAIDVVAPDGVRATRMGRAARDPDRDAVAVGLAGSSYPIDPAHPVGAALIDGTAQLHPRLQPELVRAAAADEIQLGRIMRTLGTSMLVLPLSARGKVVGALMCSWDAAAALPTGAELAHLEEVARRLALTVDNALLYAERAHIASTLQAGLLPPRLPAIPGVSVAARYLPAGEAVEVGGDFYDVFPAGQDTWSVVVGDVCGKGAEAAAVTAMARYTLRAASVAGPASPAGALRLLNSAMVAEKVPERFLTAVLAQLRPRPGGGATLTVVAAGHPAPLRVRADGTVVPVCASGALLGFVPGADWTETVVELEPGDGVVLYTDGVTEADRRAPLEPAELAALVPAGEARHSAARLAEAVRRVAEERAGGPLRDDVAIVALKLDRG